MGGADVPADTSQPSFAFDPPEAGLVVDPESPRPRVVRVRPDEPAIDKSFDYAVPDQFAESVRVGTMVRIALHGRRVGGWVVADDVEPPAGVTLQPLAKVTGWGPPPGLFDLADWAAWRWAGRPASLLRTASPPNAVRGLPRRPSLRVPPPNPVAIDEVHDLATEALASRVAVVRLAPAVDPYPLLLAAAALGPILVVAPVASIARRMGLRLRRAGLPVALLPDDWSLARAGWANVLGSRAAAWAPIPEPAAIVVLDEHDESLQQEQAPTWHARDVLLERARRAGVPCLLVSPTPSLEALAAGTLLTQSRSAERAGWPLVDLVDRREDPPGSGLFSERLVTALRSDARVVCILNRKGRSRLSACATCGEVATCERCDAAVVQGEDGHLVCPRCDASRPALCIRCGGTKMKNLRAGVSRVREELEALIREPVAELTAERGTDAGGTGTRVVVGTEAALHQVDRADVVAFLDFDQELLAPRYRAAEESLSLLVIAARLVGGRGGGGRLLVQTRLPHHEVLQAALLADPTRVAEAESSRRQMLGYPPARALALVSGASAPAWIDALGSPVGVEVLGPADDRWIVRAADHRTLCDALSAVIRPPGRLRIEVDPLRF
jgi:primosomal protein N' (replication factor Y)